MSRRLEFFSCCSQELWTAPPAVSTSPHTAEREARAEADQKKIAAEAALAAFREAMPAAR